MRAYGKSGIWNPELESGSGNRTRMGIGQINKCFRLGTMIHINTPPPFSAFLARWMMMRRALLRKGRSTKNIVVIILFSWIEFGMMLLLHKIYLLLLIGHDKPGNWLKCEYIVCVKNFWLHNLCKTKTSTL